MTQMLYQISFGLGPTSYTTAMEYVQASSFKEAWTKGDGLCQPNEIVQEVVPVANFVDYDDI